jgi:hypothetical protein
MSLYLCVRFVLLVILWQVFFDMGILNEVSDTESQHGGQEENVAPQKKRASFPSRERHYAVRRKTRSHSPPFHRCNRIPPQLPPAELPCDCDYGDSSEERQGVLYCILFPNCKKWMPHSGFKRAIFKISIFLWRSVKLKNVLLFDNPSRGFFLYGTLNQWSPRHRDFWNIL